MYLCSQLCLEPPPSSTRLIKSFMIMMKKKITIWLQQRLSQLIMANKYKFQSTPLIWILDDSRSLTHLIFPKARIWVSWIQLWWKNTNNNTIWLMLITGKWLQIEKLSWIEKLNWKENKVQGSKCLLHNQDLLLKISIMTPSRKSRRRPSTR